eukprot:2924104-Pyramimonas_sp.AAC.1
MLWTSPRCSAGDWPRRAVGFLPVPVSTVDPITVVTDCHAIVDGVAAGEARCVRPNRSYSEVWDRIWFKLQDFGADEVA